MPAELITKSKTNRNIYILALFIFCLFAAGALYYINLNSNELHKQSATAVIIMQQKTHALNGLSQSIRNRSYTLLTMLNEKDPFKLDDLNQMLDHHAFLFRKHRDELKVLNLPPKQSSLFSELLELTATNSKNQLSVANLLINEEKDSATKLLFDTAIPSQLPMAILLRDLTNSVEQGNANLLQGLQKRLDKNQQASWALMALLSILSIIFISQLISTLKTGDNILAYREAINGNVIDSALDAIVLTNDNGFISVFNKGATKLFGYEAAEVEGKSITLFLPSHFNDLITLWNNQNTQQIGIKYEDFATHKNQSKIPVQVSMTDSSVHGNHRFSLIIRDLTLNKANEQRITEQTAELLAARARYKELSETDPLTKIPNRRAYEDRLTDEINAAKRSNQPLSMIIFDIDSFKEYNDYYGHDIGDVILKRIAEVIQESLPRSTDFAARFGGEEFIVLLPSTDTFGAYQVAEKIRLNIKSLEIKHEKSNADKVVTISAGAAALAGEELNTVDLFKQADSSLYAAKENGRNRTHTFKPNASVSSFNKN